MTRLFHRLIDAMAHRRRPPDDERSVRHRELDGMESQVADSIDAAVNAADAAAVMTEQARTGSYSPLRAQALLAEQRFRRARQ